MSSLFDGFFANRMSTAAAGGKKIGEFGTANKDDFSGQLPRPQEVNLMAFESKSPASTITFPRRDTRQSLALTLGIAVLSVSSANAQGPGSPCPPVGADTACGVVITILQAGNTAASCPPQGCYTISNNQGPYDGIDDTLVGVVNASTLPVTTLVLTSGAGGSDIFDFDGDGICGLSPNTNEPYVPAPPNCPYGPTGYEGPGTSFSNISADATTGTVTFNPPIPASGGTAYFSLENDLTAATPCTSVINNSVINALINAGTGMTATFTSNTNLPYTLPQAAQLCGFSDWDWQQTVTMEPCGVAIEAGTTTPLRAPFNDPPPQGYNYQMPPNAVEIPVYWNPYTAQGTVTNPGHQLLSLADHKPTPSTMNFGDNPAVGCLSGRADGTGNRVGFTTHLVGLVGSGPGYGVQDTGIGFSWTTTFNGTSGGIHVLNSTTPVDPGSGTGGVTVTVVSNTSSYQYPKGVGVSAINGTSITSSASPPVLLGGSQIALTSSGLAYSRASQTFNGIVTVTNISSNPIDGPFQIIFDSLTAGVTLTNATSIFGGWSYISLPANSAPGQPVSTNMQFGNASNAVISASPLVYSGSLN